MSLKRAYNDEQEDESRESGPRKALKSDPTGVTITAGATQHLGYPSISAPPPRTAPPFQQPTQLIAFSYTPTRELKFDNSALKYYVEPPPGVRLDYGFDRWVRQNDERGRLDSLLRAFSRVRNDHSRNAAVKDLGVVSWRGVMTKILTAPYEDRDSWELNVMLVQGTLYFEEYISDARWQEKNNMNARQLRSTYQGYAFESYCTADTPERSKFDPNSRVPFGWSDDVNNNVQWCSVVRTKLGDMRVLIGGEVDCVRGKYTGQPDTFVELKTSLTIRNSDDEARFEKKLLKFYFQSFLLGVPEIVVGFRTPAGVVNTIQSFKTVQIPRLVRGKAGAWEPSLCLDWGNRFLNFLQSALSIATDSSESEVWRAWFSPGSGIKLKRLDARETDDVVRGEDRVGFLPRWFWDEIQGAPNPLL